jgi:DNA-binding beta-propeller fold protein YncE
MGSVWLAEGLPSAAHAQAPYYLMQWGSYGAGNGQFRNPYGVATDAAGNVYVADIGNHRIQKFGAVPTPTKTTSWGRLKRMYR